MPKKQDKSGCWELIKRAMRWIFARPESEEKDKEDTTDESKVNKRNIQGDVKEDIQEEGDNSSVGDDEKVALVAHEKEHSQKIIKKQIVLMVGGSAFSRASDILGAAGSVDVMTQVGLQYLRQCRLDDPCSGDIAMTVGRIGWGSVIINLSVELVFKAWCPATQKELAKGVGYFRDALGNWSFFHPLFLIIAATIRSETVVANYIVTLSLSSVVAVLAVDELRKALLKKLNGNEKLDRGLDVVFAFLKAYSVYRGLIYAFLQMSGDLLSTTSQVIRYVGSGLLALPNAIYKAVYPSQAGKDSEKEIQSAKFEKMVEVLLALSVPVFYLMTVIENLRQENDFEARMQGLTFLLAAVLGTTLDSFVGYYDLKKAQMNKNEANENEQVAADKKKVDESKSEKLSKGTAETLFFATKDNESKTKLRDQSFNKALVEFEQARMQLQHPFSKRSFTPAPMY